MSGAGGLTQDQKERIEANKRKALAKLSAKKAQAKGLVQPQFRGNSSVRHDPAGPLTLPVTHNATEIIRPNSHGQTVRLPVHGQGIGISHSRLFPGNVPSKSIHSAGQPLPADNKHPSTGLISTGIRPPSVNNAPVLDGNKGSSLGPPSAGSKPQSALTRTPSNGSGALLQNSNNGPNVSRSSAIGLPGKHNSGNSHVSSTLTSSSVVKNFYGPSSTVTKTGPALNKHLNSGIPVNRNFLSATENNSKHLMNGSCAGQSVRKVALTGLVKGTCVLCSRERFTVEAGFHAAMVEIFKSIKTKQYDAVNRRWSFKLEDYEQLMQKLRGLRPEVDISPLTPAVRTTFAPQFSGRYPERRIPEVDLSNVDPSLEKSLLPFQRTGVCFGVWRKGRVLIADDMGLGKTIQAICLACYYRHEWPLLVVVPSSVRFDWAQQLQRWIPSLDPQKINVIATGKDNPSSGSVVVISYDLMARKVDQLKNRHFDVIIMDESHLLKNSKTARTKAALPLIQSARRVMLLSGTPCLSRPSELYTQIVAVCPGLFKFHDFGLRYCDGKESQWGWDFTGCSNMGELQLLLEEKLMIRRLKRDVLSQLPAKQRKMVLLDPSSIKVSKHLKVASDVMNLKSLKGVERRGALLDYFHQTATAKVAAVRDYVLDLLESGQKFLMFAHHQEMLDSMETAVENKMGRCFIRIDGRTPSEQRKAFCDRFQSSDTVRVALLSITAANAGLNLTAASLVVFAELFWNPGILVQAEDRVHRIGQQDSVNVHYLVAPGTADDHIWPLVQNKLDVLSKAGLSREDFSEADMHRMEDSKQKDLREYFEESFFEDEPSLCEESEETPTVEKVLLENPRTDTQLASDISPQKTLANQTGIKQFFKQPPKVPKPIVNTKLSCDHQDQSNTCAEFEDDCDWLDDFDWEENGGEPCSKKPKL